MVYQKLGMFYEDFARENWKDAEENAEKCYRHYLAHVDQEDTAILLRLGNLLVSSNKPDRALEIFDKVISIDQSQVAAWFNRAHTQILLEQFEGAALSLQKALHLDPTLIEARHMIKALTGEKAVSMERAYVVKLFDEYAANYDQHVKSLFYSAPRVIRMELAKIYREKGAIKRPSQPSSDIETQFAASESPVDGSCTSYVSFMNNSLSILDLGCGTGQAGAWLKDYATTLVGVDVSPNMIEVARKKMLYQDLQITSMENYLAETTNTFDLIVAADSFAYVGELGEIVQKVLL